MMRNKEMYEQSLPVYPRERRILQEELNQLVVDKEQDPNERMDLDREYNEMEFEREMEAFWSGIFD
jgi:hypothetical protein